MMKLPLIFALLGLVVVVVAGVWGWSAWSREQTRATWPETEAVIDTCADIRDPNTGYWSYHYFAHRTMPDGQRHDYDGYSSACTPGPYRVRYDPKDPSTLASLEGSRSYFAALIPAFIGFAFMYLGIRVWLRERKAPVTPQG